MSLRPIDELLRQSQQRDAWLRLLERHPEGRVEYHPDLVQHATPAGERAWVYTQPAEGGSEFSALAVLIPQRLQVVRLRHGRESFSHTGYRVVLNRALGADTDAARAKFLDEAIAFLDSGEADALYFDVLESKSSLWNHLTALDYEHRVHLHTHLPDGPLSHWWLDFPDTPAEYWNQFTGKARYKMRRKLKNIEHSLIKVTRDEQIPEFLRAAARISSRSWQGKKYGLRITDCTKERRFHHLLAEHGNLRSYLLDTPEGPIAFMRGYQSGDCYVHDEIGFDLAHRGISPGTILMYRVIEDFLADNCPRQVDFGLGENEYKRHFGNRELHSGPVVMMARRLRPWVSLMVEQCRRVAHSKARDIVRSERYRRARAYVQPRALYRRVRRVSPTVTN